MGPTGLTVAGNWLAVVQVVFGFVALVTGLRNRGTQTEIVAPLGAVFLIQGVARLLGGTVAAGILITVEAAVLAAAIAWFVRVNRASGARIRERVARRDPSQS